MVQLKLIQKAKQHVFKQIKHQYSRWRGQGDQTSAIVLTKIERRAKIPAREESTEIKNLRLGLTGAP